MEKYVSSKKITKIALTTFFLLFIIFAGFLTGLYTEDQTKKDLTGKEVPHQPKFGLADYLDIRENKYSTPLVPNESGWADSFGVPPYKVNINSQGFRNEYLSQNSSKSRILIIGDSTTFGVGVNTSSTYPELIENKLNKKYDREYEVINAGVPGFGMKDYYKLLENKGLDFDPELVIIGFIGNDWLSMEDSMKIANKVNKNIKKENITGKEEINKRKTTLKLINKKYNQTEMENSSMSYMEKFPKLTGNKTKIIFYALDTLRSKQRDYVEDLDNQGINVYYAPKQYRRSNKTDVRISKWDKHPDDLGHEKLYSKIFPVIVDNLGIN